MSLAIQLPAFIISLGLTLALALLAAAFRGRPADWGLTIAAVMLMSIPGVSIYLGAQWLLGAKWRWFPVAGWDLGFYALHYAALPILVSIFAGLGGGVRFYRTVALEEVGGRLRPHRPGQGRGRGRAVADPRVPQHPHPRHHQHGDGDPAAVHGGDHPGADLPNPGLGNLLDTAVLANDRPVVMFLVYVTSVIYCLALVVNDICYTLADPRVVLQ